MAGIFGLSSSGGPCRKDGVSLRAPQRSSPEELDSAARQFEALLLGHLLRAARREASQGEGAATSLLEMAEDQLVELLASRGGLGLARTIVEQFTGPGSALTPNLAVTPNPADKGQER